MRISKDRWNPFREMNLRALFFTCRCIEAQRDRVQKLCWVAPVKETVELPFRKS
jgi:hypothetical protein